MVDDDGDAGGDERRQQRAQAARLGLDLDLPAAPDDLSQMLPPDRVGEIRVGLADQVEAAAHDAGAVERRQIGARRQDGDAAQPIGMGLKGRQQKARCRCRESSAGPARRP